MNIPAHPTIIRSMCDARVNKLRATCPVLAASLVTIEKTCGRLGCHCQRGEKHVGDYLTFKVAGKTKTVYVPRAMVAEVRSWIQEHRRLRKLSDEISQLAIAQVRSFVTQSKRRTAKSKSSARPSSGT